jgi:uncharacterized protein YkwD
VTRSSWNRFWRLGVLCAALGATAPTWASPLSAVDVLRAGGCGGIMPAARPLRHNPFLDRAAAEWALGRPLPVASAENGFPGGITGGVHVSGPDSSTLQQLRQVGCRIVAGPEMRDIGLYRRGFDTWIVVASIYRLPPGMIASSGTWVPGAPVAGQAASPSWNSPSAARTYLPGWNPPPRQALPQLPAPQPAAPPPDETARVMAAPAATARAMPAPTTDSWDAPAATTAAPTLTRASATRPTAPLAANSTLANRALELINQVRSKGTHCGDELFGPAPPVSLSGTLDTVASGHAIDMAEKNYFEHVDPAGHSPADRVRATGYQEKLVGENIAYGPKSVDEVVQGWLDSPGHCENIMDPRFAEMGIALAPGRAKHGLYWVQVFAEPRA